MTDYEFQILKVLNEENSITQRHVSEKTNISLGKTNITIKELIKKTYIKKIQFKDKKTTYELTENGITELDNAIKRISNTKIKLHSGVYYKVRQAVILGAGYNKEFDRPSGFLEVDEITLIERMMSILKENGIEKFIIVTGYKSDYFDELARKYSNVYCVKNEEYKWTGTMKSLELAKEYITDDFILVENDLIFENRAIKNVLEDKYRDCILITNESGSGDEAFVEIRDGYIFKMAKDIHQFNKIDGEMIGISKISFKLYNRMLKEYENNENPYMNYEYTLIDVSKNYNIAYTKINDLMWGEIDNKKQYENIKKIIFPMIKRKEAEYKIDEVVTALMDGLGVIEEKIEDISPVGGMTNKNYKATVDGQDYIIRMPGNGTSSMINRYDEMFNSKAVSKENLDANILFFDAETGIKIAEFIEGAETLNAARAKNTSNMQKVACLLRRLHNSDIKMNNKFDIFEKIEEYEVLMKDNNGEFFEDYYEVKGRIIGLKDVLEQNGFEMRPSHNDIVPENLVKDINERMYLIDWEYSGLNDPMWDLAAFSLECDFNEDEEKLFFNMYFNGDTPKENNIRIIINKILQDFIWSIWAKIKEAQGDDFGSYAGDRYSRGKENLEKLFKLI